jgi:flavin-dependent dehydrogenase
LRARGCQAEISLPKAVSLSRNALDAALIEAGISSGVHFLPETHATLGATVSGRREVILTHAGKQLTASAKLVLAADGLGSQFLSKQDDFTAVAEHGSRIGAGVVLASPPPFIQPRTIYMACSSGGYVGMVTLENGRLNVAAALDRETVRVAGGLSAAAANIIAEVGLPKIEGMTDQPWRGTAALTRQASNLSCERVFVLGDAAGYVEPFTGEGIAWALGSAVAIVPLALRAVERWDANLGREWSNVVRNTVRSRQGICRAMAWGLRHPRIVRSAITMLRYMPSLAVPVVRRLNAPA